MYSDCHAHLHLFSEEEVEEMIKKGVDKGVELVFAASIDYESSLRTLELADHYENVCPCVGIHPWVVQEITEEEIQKVLQLSKEEAPIISEVGLDFVYNSDNKPEQIELFRRFLEVSVEKEKALIIHVRDAFEKAIEILREYPRAFGAVHCFNGTLEEAEIFGELGFYTSISNAVLSELTHNMREILENLALENMVVDTDTLPGTFEISHAVEINRAIAREKELNIEDTAQVITNNSKTLLRKED